MKLDSTDEADTAAFHSVIISPSVLFEDPDISLPLLLWDTDSFTELSLPLGVAM